MTELAPPFDPPALDEIERAPFPPLRGSARPVAQDRWERLVSAVVVPAPIGEVWTALTDPQRIALWLAPPSGRWATEGESCALDFHDGEFFWCHTDIVRPPAADSGSALLSHRWRWVGVGPATRVDWELTSLGDSTSITATETCRNGPADWRSWNGMGWPGILDQLADHVRTGRDVRWTWRRMGPYVQTELPVSAYEAWAALTAVPALQFWMGRSRGSLAVDDPMTFVLGDASGSAVLRVTDHVEAGQRFPSYLPSLDFELTRGGWPGVLQGHLWVEPTGLGGSLLQVFHNGWEMFGTSATAPHDRTLLCQFWSAAFGRLGMLLAGPGGHGGPPPGPHSWSV